MEGVLGFFVALFLSILIVPVLTKHAGRLGMIDIPDGRKSHIGLVPRVGGIAIAISAIIPPILWITHEAELLGFLAGGILIVLFGALDDRFNLDYRIKLLGQMAAAVVAVALDICLYHIPFVGLDAIPEVLAAPLTVLFILAVTNAFNLLDGLDGLAAGCAILSLVAIAILAFFANGGTDLVVIAFAVIGGVLGFLRYNTYPASVFMGDAGSQFLGFSIATLSIILIEHTQNAMSPAVILPLLGLPVLDTCMVMLVRIREGRSPFSPDRNHIHHKLLSIGLKHYQAVAVIYAVQAVIVSTALVLRYESDVLVLLVYAAICLTCIAGYAVCRRLTGGRLDHGVVGSRQHHAVVLPSYWRERIIAVATRYVEWSIAGYLIVGAISVRSTSIDVSLLALVLAALLAGTLFIWRKGSALVTRLSAYLMVIYVSYVSIVEPGGDWLNALELAVWIGSVILTLAIVIALAPTDKFRLSTLDLLIVLVVVAALWIPIPGLDHEMTVSILIRCVVFLYACEVLLEIRGTPIRPVGLAAGISLLVIAAQVLAVGS